MQNDKIDLPIFPIDVLEDIHWYSRYDAACGNCRCQSVPEVGKSRLWIRSAFWEYSPAPICWWLLPATAKGSRWHRRKAHGRKLLLRAAGILRAEERAAFQIAVKCRPQNFANHLRERAKYSSVWALDCIQEHDPEPLEELYAAIRRGRNDQDSSPCSRPPRNPR
jgi:hypothetical protein